MMIDKTSTTHACCLRGSLIITEAYQADITFSEICRRFDVT